MMAKGATIEEAQRLHTLKQSQETSILRNQRTTYQNTNSNSHRHTLIHNLIMAVSSFCFSMWFVPRIFIYGHRRVRIFCHGRLWDCKRKLCLRITMLRTRFYRACLNYVAVSQCNKLLLFRHFVASY